MMISFEVTTVFILVAALTTDPAECFAFPRTGDDAAAPLGFHKNCPTGYELQHDRRTNKYECTCKKYHLYWPLDGLCYREFQQGPCPEGHR